MQQVLTQTGYAEILINSQVLAMAQGSPGAAIASWQQLQTIPPELLQACMEPPRSPRRALELARQIDQALDTDAQVWLVDYLQQVYWQQQWQPRLLYPLEQARQHLLSYAQPRLVWEVALLTISQSD
jgi:DNA polymerase-3 subunit delta'